MSCYFSVEIAKIGKFSFNFEKIEKIFSYFNKEKNFFIDRKNREFICMEWKDNYSDILENNYLFIQGDKDKELILSFHTEVRGDYLFNSLKGYGCQFS